MPTIFQGFFEKVKISRIIISGLWCSPVFAWIRILEREWRELHVKEYCKYDIFSTIRLIILHVLTNNGNKSAAYFLKSHKETLEFTDMYKTQLIADIKASGHAVFETTIQSRVIPNVQNEVRTSSLSDCLQKPCYPKRVLCTCMLCSLG